jgi:hypothetical protein
MPLLQGTSPIRTMYSHTVEALSQSSFCYFHFASCRTQHFSLDTHAAKCFFTAMVDGYEITHITLECLFIIGCCIYCYGTEIWIRTPWAHLRPGYIIHSLAQKRRARKSKGILPDYQREESQKTQPVREIAADD